MSEFLGRTSSTYRGAVNTPWTAWFVQNDKVTVRHMPKSYSQIHVYNQDMFSLSSLSANFNTKSSCQLFDFPAADFAILCNPTTYWLVWPRLTLQPTAALNSKAFLWKFLGVTRQPSGSFYLYQGTDLSLLQSPKHVCMILYVCLRLCLYHWYWTNALSYAIIIISVIYHYHCYHHYSCHYHHAHYWHTILYVDHSIG